jgi:hypothetical protein
MCDPNRALTPTELRLADIDELQLGFEDRSPEFIQAFCELLEIQEERRSEPIVLMPRGPQVAH